MIIIKYIKLMLYTLCIFIILLINVHFNKKINTTELNISKTMKESDYNEIINNLRNEYKNDDIVGILKIDNQLEVPILQTIDNDYYLNHTIEKKENIYGAVFLDYRIDINDKKILIYGHSSIKNNIPFNVLENYYDKEYYKNHKYTSLITSEGKKIYEIFSVYIETSDFSYMNINFIDNKDYYKHIQSLKYKSIYDTGIELKEDDEVLILQTCSNHEDYKNYNKKYLLILSRRIK